MADDDKMTVRERRAQHAKEQARKDAPKTLLRKAAVPALVVLVLAGVAAGFYFTNKNAEACPGHFHSTFGIFIPGDNGTYEKVDFAGPRAPSGGAYYDLSNRASRQAISTHMHQSGPEQGSAALGPSQLHFESAGCYPLEDSLKALDLRVNGDSIELSGGHEQVNQGGTFEGNLHFYLQDTQGRWSEEKWSSWDNRQMPDGYAFMIVVGDYTDAQIEEMKAGIPAPISRQAGFSATTGGNHSA
jgi:hypothetical protein